MTRSCALSAGTVTSAVRPIEDLVVGDIVWAWNEEAARLVRRRVSRLFRHPGKATLRVLVSGDTQHTIEATTEHPFWVLGKGWTPANRLKPGDRLKPIVDSDNMIVVGVCETGLRTKVFNFEVEESHNYFVGEEGALVHNSSSKSEFPSLPYAGFPVPVRTGARLEYQFADLDRITVDPHYHPATVWDGDRRGYSGYSNLPAGDIPFEQFLDGRGPSTFYRLSSIPQSLNQGCCPIQPYYLAKFAGNNGYTLAPRTAELLPGNKIRFPEDVQLDADNGVPAVIRAGVYNALDLGLSTARSPKFPRRGKVSVEYNVIPSASLVYEGSARQRDLVDHMGDLISRRPDLRERTSIGIVSVSPRLPGGAEELKNVLAYSMQRFGRHGPRFDGLGEVNFGFKEAVESQLTLGGAAPFDWGDLSNASDFLGFLNNNMPGAIATVHMDAGDSVEVGLEGASQRLLIHAPTNYRNVDELLKLVLKSPNVNFIWAHAGGLSRSGYPGTYKTNGMHAEMLAYAAGVASNLYFDMSWGTVADKVIADNRAFGGWAGARGAGVMNRYPDRFLFGTDEVGQNLQTYSGPLRKYYDGGIIGNLRDPEAFLRTNALRLIRPAASAFDRYMLANSDALLARPLTGPWGG
jgi:hypothetical protein